MRSMYEKGTNPKITDLELAFIIAHTVKGFSEVGEAEKFQRV